MIDRIEMPGLSTMLLGSAAAVWAVGAVIVWRAQNRARTMRTAEDEEVLPIAWVDRGVALFWLPLLCGVGGVMLIGNALLTALAPRGKTARKRKADTPRLIMAILPKS